MIPTVASSIPPTVGPSMRLALLAPTSSDIAALILPGPTTSPIIVRRIGLSVVHAMPLTKLATARCQTRSRSVHARSARTSDVSSMEKTTRTSAVRRSRRAAAAPTTAPSKAIGRIRSIVNIATTNGEPVRR